MFYNYSTEKFTYPWGNKPFSFEPGGVYDGIIISDDKSSSLQLNEITSRFFSKHLAEHLLNQNKEVSKDALKYNFANMELLIERGIAPPGMVKQMPDFASELNIKSDPALEVVSQVIVDPAENTVTAEKPKKAAKPKKVLSPSPEAVFDGV